MHVVGSLHPTAHVRRIFTPALNIPLATEERETEDAQGSLTLYFHEGKDERGNASDKVLGVTSCHVLRKTINVDYEFQGPSAGGAKQYVRINGRRRFQQGLDDIKALFRDNGMLADLSAGQIVKLEEKMNLDSEDARELRRTREKLLEQQEAISELGAFYDEVKDEWSDIGLRNIGHVRYAKAISVDVEGGTLHTEDWAAFEVVEAKFKPEFEGNFVDLGAHAF